MTVVPVVPLVSLVSVVTPRACAWGNVIGFVCCRRRRCCLLAQKSPDLEI